MNEIIVYRKLQRHLDGLPGGFGQATAHKDIQLLRKLFTPKEAELAVNLTLERETPGVIASRAGLTEAEARQRLDSMATKGLLFSAVVDGVMRYQAAPWVIGIYEFHVNSLDDELLRCIDQYYSHLLRRPRNETTTQMRIVPINQSIDTRMAVLPYERVDALIAAHTKFGVAPCICRTNEKLHGRGCSAPVETCLLFGDFAEFYARTGRGRLIDRSEVLSILAEANRSNLVLNPTNSKSVSAICCCCGCCCGILQALKFSPKPAQEVISSFIVHFQPEECNGCGDCIERCQMQAITAGDLRPDVNTDRCIGCGLCVSTCSTGALSLKRKPVAEIRETPDTFQETWVKITLDRDQKTQRS